MTTVEAKNGRSWTLLFLFILWALPAYFTIGHVGATLWRWFVLPIFAAAPHFTPAQFAGIWIVLRFLRGISVPDDEAPAPSPAEFSRKCVTVGVYLPLVTLFFGWAIKAVWL